MEEDSKIRRLCTTEDSKKDTAGIDCETESGGSGYVINDTTNGYCGDIQKQCEGGNTVDIYRTFSNGERVTVNICGPSTTVLANNKKGRITFRAPGLTKINMQYRNYGCTFDGNDLTQQEGEVCDASSDCARKHKCYQQSEGGVRLCRDDCTKNFRGEEVDRSVQSRVVAIRVNALIRVLYRLGLRLNRHVLPVHRLLRQGQ